MCRSGMRGGFAPPSLCRNGWARQNLAARCSTNCLFSRAWRCGHQGAPAGGVNVSLRNLQGTPISDTDFFAVRARSPEDDREPGPIDNGRPRVAGTEAGGSRSTADSEAGHAPIDPGRSGAATESGVEDEAGNRVGETAERTGNRNRSESSTEATAAPRYTRVIGYRIRRAAWNNGDGNPDDAVPRGPTWNALFAAAVANTALDAAKPDGLGVGALLIQEKGVTADGALSKRFPAGPVSAPSTPTGDSAAAALGQGNVTQDAGERTSLIVPGLPPRQPVLNEEVSPSPRDLRQGLGHNPYVGQLVSVVNRPWAGTATPAGYPTQPNAVDHGTAESRSPMETGGDGENTTDSRPTSSNARGAGLGGSGLLEWFALAQSGTRSEADWQPTTGVVKSPAKGGPNEVGTTTAQAGKARPSELARLGLSGPTAFQACIISASLADGKSVDGKSPQWSVEGPGNGAGTHERRGGDEVKLTTANQEAVTKVSQSGTPGTEIDDLSFSARLTRKSITEPPTDSVDLMGDVGHSAAASKGDRPTAQETTKPAAPWNGNHTGATLPLTASIPAKSGVEIPMSDSRNSARVPSPRPVSEDSAPVKQVFSGGASSDGAPGSGGRNGGDEQTGSGRPEVAGKEPPRTASGGEKGTGEMGRSAQEEMPSFGNGGWRARTGSPPADGGGQWAKAETMNAQPAGSGNGTNHPGLAVAPAAPPVSPQRSGAASNSSERGAAAGPGAAPLELRPGTKPVTVQPVKQLSLAMSTSEDQNVEVRLMDRAGRIHVAVRTADPALSTALRGDLGDLVTRLEGRGFQADVWTPGATPTGNGNHSGGSDPQRNPWDGSGNGNQNQAQQQDRSQQGRREQEDRAAAWRAQVQQAEHNAPGMESEEAELEGSV